jgi:hypothetical protein
MADATGVKPLITIALAIKDVGAGDALIKKPDQAIDSYRTAWQRVM